MTHSPDSLVLWVESGWLLIGLSVCLSACVSCRASKVETVEVLCFRDRTLQGCRSVQHSIIFHIKLPKLSPNSGKVCTCACGMSYVYLMCHAVWTQ